MNKFNAILGEVEVKEDDSIVEEALIDLTSIRHRLDGYLNYSVQELLVGTDAVIFGGAVRDRS